jgi:hypothetical protein
MSDLTMTADRPPLLCIHPRESVPAPIAKALVAVAGKVRNPGLDASNPAYKSKYATLPAILDLLRPLLAEEGVMLAMPFSAGDNTVTIHPTLMASDGTTWYPPTLCLPVNRWDAQGIGSAVTYGRRYLCLAIFGIAGDDDDDGNAASQRPAPSAQVPASERPLNEQNVQRVKDAMAEWDLSEEEAVNAITENAKSSLDEMTADEAVLVVKWIAREKAARAKAAKEAKG